MAGLLRRRLKNAAKCLLGKEINGKITPHQYVLEISDEAALSGKKVLVTGGTGAIGSSICFELAAEGAIVGVCGRSEEKTREIISNMVEKNPVLKDRLFPVIVDVTVDGQIEKAISDWVSKFGGIDAFINNAGGQPGRVGKKADYIWEKEIDDIDLVLNTNLRSVIMCTRTAASYMIPEKKGVIINMGSVIGIGGKSGMSDYAAAKAGVGGFTRSSALELGKFGIRVNCISPGFINQTAFDEGSPTTHITKNVLGRRGFTREIAVTVSFLLKNEYVTGQNFVIDGGRSIGLYGD